VTQGGSLAIAEASRLIRQSRFLTDFTGAGISVESGIPPFCGEGGLWNRYNPRLLELDYFRRHPEKAWPVIKEIFYDHFAAAWQTRGHEVLAAWEHDGWPRELSRGGPSSAALDARGYLQILITQNVDSV